MSSSSSTSALLASNTTASSSSSSSAGVVALPPNQLYVHEVQRGNPLLAHIKNVKWSFTKEILPDYATSSACALFLSLKYHFRHPKHIVRRIDEVGRNYRLRVLLVLVDDETNLVALQELNRIAFVSNFTLICAWSNIECARYLETLKSYENKSSSSIQAKEETEFLPRLSKVLTSVRSVNKTDVTTLLDVFGNFSNICNAQEQQLVLCPGLGEKKVKRLYAALHEPFNATKKPRGTTSMFQSKSKSVVAEKVSVLDGVTDADGVSIAHQMNEVDITAENKEDRELDDNDVEIVDTKVM